MTVNLGKPAAGDNIFVNHTVIGAKYAFTQYNIPLKNVVDPTATTTVVVTADGTALSTSSVRIYWSYNIENPRQENYKVELATDIGFTTDKKTISGAPIASETNFIEKLLATLNINYFFTKIVNAETSVQDTREVVVGGLRAGIKYYAKVSVYDGDKWIESNVFDVSTFGAGLSVSCSVDDTNIAVGGSVTYTANALNTSGTIAYKWIKAGAYISGEESNNYDVVYGTEGTYSNIKAEVSDGVITKTDTCLDVVVGGGGGDNTDPPIDDPDGDPSIDYSPCPARDGIIIPHNGTYKFWENRISKECNGEIAKCINGTLKQAASTTLNFDTDTFKYQKCAEPVPVEF